MNSQTILLYVLRSIFISGVFFSYYWLALRNKSFNSYNRFYLLLSMACSLVLPLFNFSWFTIEKKELPVSTETFRFITTQITTDTTTTFSWPTVLAYLAIGISLFLITLFVWNIAKVYQLKKRCVALKMDGINFMNTDLDNAPFSFLNNLFWRASIPLDEDYGKKIFKHELTHIHQRHTLDIIFCQFVTAVFWMNPFNWLIQKELKAIHEFIADKEAVGDNNVEEFVKLLLQAHYGNHFLNPTHAFHYSSIKRRLFMLTTKNKTTWGPLRKGLVLPVSLLVVIALSISTIESKAKAIVAPVIAPQRPVLPSPAQQPEKPVTKNDTTPAPKALKSFSFPLTIKGNEPKKKQDNDEVITLIADKIIIKSSADSAKVIPNVLYYIDNQFATGEEVHKLKPEQIKLINVLKGDAAIKKYGAAGTNGAVEVFTKRDQ